MSSISFSPAARTNLESILQEFVRCTNHYPPLYHQRLIPWSETGQVSISRSQWETFQQTHDDSLDESSWFEWDGPNRQYLGMWLGEEDGLDVFVNLVESLAMVFRSEEPVIDGFDIDFHRSDWCAWLPLLHDWAFNFQMPLLRSDMFLWQAEDESPEDFYELAEQWQVTSGVQYPKHPVVWRLVDNVFTSSIAAIQALLEPEYVIATNNPWKLIGTQSRDSSRERSDLATWQDQAITSSQQYHRLVFGGDGWSVRFAGDDHPHNYSTHAGLTRLAHLIESAPKKFSPEELYQFGARNFSRRARLRQRNSVEDDLSGRSSLDIEQEMDDEEGRNDVQQRLEELHEERRNAENNSDKAAIARIDKECEGISQHYYVKGIEVKKQRTFPKKQRSSQYKAVKKTIDEAIAAIAKDRKDVSEELVSQFDHDGGFQFSANTNYTPWRVERRPEKSKGLS